MYKPLADKIRPTTLDDVVGQKHILGENGLLKRAISSKNITNMIFYGPSGVGKTTVAKIIANQTNRHFEQLNATTASIADIKAIIDNLDTLLTPNGVLLYLDEIQYFNKKQQQSLLEFIENGKIVLVASTTENPYFYVYNAILSRSIVYEFKPVEPFEIKKVLKKALCDAEISDEHIDFLANASQGDVRKAINMVETLLNVSNFVNGKYYIQEEDIIAITGNSSLRYDKNGDEHYNILSAFQKSIRGSDPDASVHYLARLILAGDLKSICRRLLIICAEDVGLAYPQASPIVKSLVDGALMVGLPEASILLSKATILLATSPKSNSTYIALNKAISDIETTDVGDIPAHLKDAHFSGAKKLGRGLTYKYPHDYKNHYVEQQYLPNSIKNKKYYEFADNKFENLSKIYFDKLKKGEN